MFRKLFNKFIVKCENYYWERDTIEWYDRPIQWLVYNYGMVWDPSSKVNRRRRKSR